MQGALSTLEMPRFTRRYPKLTDAVLRQMMSLTHDFEAQYLDELAEQQRKKQQKQQRQQQRQEQEGGSCDNEEQSGGGDCDDGDPDEDQDGEGNKASGQSMQVRRRPAVTRALVLNGAPPCIECPPC